MRWPDWAVLWADRAWVIELKTEAGSHRADQLRYYLRLAAAAHPRCNLYLTYITGPLTKPAPVLLEGQRHSHLTSDQVLPLIEEAWASDTRCEVVAYVDMVKTLVENLGRLKPSAQREVVLGLRVDEPKAVSIEGPATVGLSTSRPKESLTSLLRSTAAGSWIWRFQRLLPLSRRWDGRCRGGMGRGSRSLFWLLSRCQGDLASVL